MTDQHPAAEDDGSIGPVHDHEPLRDREDVPFHEVTEVVDGETVETIAALDDMAPVGVVNEAGEVLVVRVTEDCAWKIPSAAVEPGADYAATARQWVADQAGLEISFGGIAGVWSVTVRDEDGGEDATRNFVVFRATPAAGEPSASESGSDDVADGSATDVGWFDELPADAEAVPGTDLFFE